MPPISELQGHIPGYPPGSKFEDRVACCHAGVHGHTQAGIHSPGGKARSITLSGRYEDDMDKGTYFIYTGEGGRKDRSKIQDEDQAWCKGNLHLMNACKKRSAIRVIRGYGERNSTYATEKGYRYDGLYVITRAWRQKGKQNKLMCRFLFQKLKNQNSLTWGPDDVEPYNSDKCHVPPSTDPKSWTSLPPDIDAPTSTSPSPAASSSSSSRSPSIASSKSNRPASRPQLSANAKKASPPNVYTPSSAVKRPLLESSCDRLLKRPNLAPVAPMSTSWDRLLQNAGLATRPIVKVEAVESPRGSSSRTESPEVAMTKEEPL
ncbi:hypothetical protein BDZ89DRAFT_1087017 [Hymenopellis radicata]|nr:hypothetical protein BDZ89DRAFT_1087017 [Hymenopellis radicata]